ncbi:MAG: response regulator transcription factor [Dehalococcoidales bacterium]|nr:MAG: response regulator transcription factor [Dehalococcoidales bacterium]
MKVLIIEDNAEVVEAVSLCLQIRWPDADISFAYGGLTGVQMVESQAYDIVILDINLPGINGFEVLKRIRSFSSVPVIILTVRGWEEDQVEGLELGADDYIVKPFRPRELVSRVNSVLRRVNTAASGIEDHSLVRGAIRLLLNSNEVQMEEGKIRLTPTECKVLYALMKNDGQTLSSKILLTEILGREDGNTEIIRTYIRRLRSKLQDSPPSIILNDRGGGYRFVSPK